MDAPKRLDPDALYESVQEWMRTHARKVTAEESSFVRGRDRKYLYLCNVCSSVIESRVCFISIHIAGFSQCTGPGRVKRVAFPYCPKCEPGHDDYGCVHVQ